MPSLPKVLQMVDESEPGDWRKFEPEWGLPRQVEWSDQTWVYEHDVELRIELGETMVKDFHAEWTDVFPSTTDESSHAFWIVYGRSPIERVSMVLVDGARTYIPFPDGRHDTEDGLSISRHQDAVASIVNSDFTEYRQKLDRADIDIQ